MNYTNNYCITLTSASDENHNNMQDDEVESVVKYFRDHKYPYAYCTEVGKNGKRHMHAAVLSNSKGLCNNLTKKIGKLHPHTWPLENGVKLVPRAKRSILCKTWRKGCLGSETKDTNGRVVEFADCWVDYLEKDEAFVYSDNWPKNYLDFIEDNKPVIKARNLNILFQDVEDLWIEHKMPMPQHIDELDMGIQWLCNEKRALTMPSWNRYKGFIIQCYAYLTRSGMGLMDLNDLEESARKRRKTCPEYNKVDEFFTERVGTLGRAS